MRKIIVSLFSLFLLMTAAKSQDVIYFNSGGIVKAIVTEINKKDVKYKKFSNPDGPLIIIRKNKIEKIEYENGDIENFAELAKTSDIEFKRNIFYYNVFDIVYGQFAIGFEHLSKNGIVGYYLPFAVGFTDYNGPKDYIEKGFTGFGVNLYPTGQHRVTYFLGPEIIVGMGETESRYYDDATYRSYYVYKDFIYGRFFINNGINYNPVPSLRISAVLGLGIRYFDIDDDDHNYYSSGFKSSAYFTISMGFAF